MPDFSKKEMEGIVSDLRDVFIAHGANYDEGDEEDLVEDPPEERPFPYIAFAVACFKDFSDVILDLTGVGSALASYLSFFSSFFLLVWFFNRANTGSKITRTLFNKVVKDKAKSKILGTVICELIPFIQIIPSNCMFVLWVHNQDKAIIREVNRILEEHGEIL